MRYQKIALFSMSLMVLFHSAMISAHAEDGWRKVYETVLTEFQETDEFSSDSENGSMWNIFDVNSDGVPELFISPNTSHEAGCIIYAFKDGEGIRLGEENQQFGEWGVTSVCQAESLIMTQYFQMGFLDVAYYHFDGETVELVDSFNDNEGALVGGKETAVYSHNGETVTKEEYYNALEQYHAMHWVDEIGREYTFSQLDLFKGDIPPAKEPVIVETVTDNRPDFKTVLLYGGIPALIIGIVLAIVTLVWRHS